MRIVVIGPSASGKSAVGEGLAARLGMPFADADALHPPANLSKMASGTPLTDDDRMPWLDVVAHTLRDARTGIVVACSALTRRYRERLLAGCPDVRFVELRVPHAELERRMRAREHFMPVTLLSSQLELWEPLESDEPGVSVENADGIDAVVAETARSLAC